MFVRIPLILRGFALLTAAAALAGCGPGSELDRAGKVGPLSGPFYVSDYFSPSGHMGDAQMPGHITALIGEEGLEARREWCAQMVSQRLLLPEQCPDRPIRPDGRPAGGDPYTFIYSPSDLLWAGVYWVYPTNSWGSRPGRAIDPNYRYSRVTFYAATDTPTTPTQFIIGGITDPLLDYKDQFRRSIFTTDLGYEYKQYEITIPAGATFTSVIGGFCWVTEIVYG
jgi:hypothetical protein